jgi:hypothetical protein
MTVLVNSDANNLPAGGFSVPMDCSLIDTVTLQVCDTVGSFSAEIHGADADAADTIYVTSFGVPAGASLTTVDNGTPHPVSTFSWNATTAGAGTYTFFMKFNDNACPMSGTQTIAYMVKVVDCAALPTGGTERLLGAAGISVFPNPSNGEFTVNLGQSVESATINVIDIYGREVNRQTVSGNGSMVVLDLKYLPEGTYSMRVISNTGAYNQKITIIR